MNNTLRTAILAIFSLALVPVKASSQVVADAASIEAYINDHKEQRSILLMRSTLEASNRLLHDYCADAAMDYRDISVELDRYTRAFDVIDILFQSLRTSLNVYRTYSTANIRISDYRQMLEQYSEKCLSRGDIVSTDTLIISVNVRALQRITRECDELYRSMSDLALYVTGAMACSTSSLLIIINHINDSLDNIQRQINMAYFDTWRYIQVRTGYWKARVYRARSKEEMAFDAFSRWQNAGKLDY